jgi:hypothetical protein
LLVLDRRGFDGDMAARLLCLDKRRPDPGATWKALSYNERRRAKRLWNWLTGAIVASGSLGTFGCTGRMIDPVRIRFAQAPQLCQKRGKVGSVKQRLLAELNVFEVTSFDRCVERSATDTEQVKCLPDPVSCLRKTESTGVNRIVARVLVGASSWHCSIRRIVYA